MKNINKILVTISSIVFLLVSCTGEDGFDGRDGLNGLNGDDSAQTIIYELGGINFNTANDYRSEEIIPDDIEIFSSDTVDVFRFIGEDNNGDEVWEPIPQSYFIEQGTVIFSFDFTVERVALFLIADFNLDLLNDPLLTDDQIFRFAVNPGFTSSSSNLLSSNRSYSQVAKNAEVIKLN